MNDALSLSAAGLDFIAAREGFRATVYADAAGYPTIGFGHRLLPTEEFPDGISREAARAMLKQDAGQAEETIRQRVAVDLTQAEFDALVSFVFNVGAGNFADSTLLTKLNAGDFPGAADQFPAWDKIRVNSALIVNRGLADRRNAERALFLNRVYGVSAPLNA